MTYDQIYDIVRGTGYVTRGQADEITQLLLAALSNAPTAAQPGNAALIPICSRVLAAFRELGAAEHLRETYAARHECESAILALDNAIRAAMSASPSTATKEGEL